jgi:hypothetical protein
MKTKKSNTQQKHKEHRMMANRDKLAQANSRSKDSKADVERMASRQGKSVGSHLPKTKKITSSQPIQKMEENSDALSHRVDASQGGGGKIGTVSYVVRDASGTRRVYIGFVGDGEPVLLLHDAEEMMMMRSKSKTSMWSTVESPVLTVYDAKGAICLQTDFLPCAGFLQTIFDAKGATRETNLIMDCDVSTSAVYDAKCIVRLVSTLWNDAKKSVSTHDSNGTMRAHVESHDGEASELHMRDVKGNSFANVKVNADGTHQFSIEDAPKDANKEKQQGSPRSRGRRRKA